jgi:hypothetical protein
MTDTKQPTLCITYAKQIVRSMKYIKKKKKTDYGRQLKFKVVQLNLI